MPSRRFHRIATSRLPMARRVALPSCRTWVGDDPNAVTNLRFRTTYEN
jgi:hypothetical protein